MGWWWWIEAWGKKEYNLAILWAVGSKRLIRVIPGNGWMILMAMKGEEGGFGKGNYIGCQNDGNKE